MPNRGSTNAGAAGGIKNDWMKWGDVAITGVCVLMMLRGIISRHLMKGSSLIIPLQSKRVKVSQCVFPICAAHPKPPVKLSTAIPLPPIALFTTIAITITCILSQRISPWLWGDEASDSQGIPTAAQPSNPPPPSCLHPLPHCNIPPFWRCPPTAHFSQADGLFKDKHRGRHLVIELIKQAKKEWECKHERASKTLSEAVAEYEHWYKRLPPKGFDDWQLLHNILYGYCVVIAYSPC
ncbi:hypothetical protein BDN71DRAFT_1436270 [Pleurotus eryngii]|uniref:Uncharacterized protein n=1 Tax=Pleurotus eryngii TaxID=5323 RepID=A0A9P5ZKZ3_PLEER|nr:hypothetical protein BDN71DRAFT_1436270 [Pleurotus eryngii]